MEQREQVATTAQARRLEHSNSTTRNNPMKACVSDRMANDQQPIRYNAGDGGYSVESGLLQHQSHNSQWPGRVHFFFCFLSGACFIPSFRLIWHQITLGTRSIMTFISDIQFVSLLYERLWYLPTWTFQTAFVLKIIVVKCAHEICFYGSSKKPSS